MLKIILLLIFFTFTACKSVDTTNDGIIIAPQTSSTNMAVFNKLPSNIPTNKNKGLFAKDFGAKGDAIQHGEFSIKGNELTTAKGAFTSDDVGKVFSIAHAGANDEHLIGTITKYISPTTVRLSSTASKNVANAYGSYGTNNIVFLQNAIDKAIELNAPLYVDEGVYLIGERNAITNESFVRIKMNKPNQNLTLIGAGKDKTIFRELDGKTQRIGRWTKLFFHHLKDSPNINSIYIGHLAFDKNGRSLTKNPPKLYEWEQAHCISWASHPRATSYITIETLHLEHIEIIDKIGGGINYSSGLTRVGKAIVTNITEKDYAINKKIYYGERGDIEISCFSEDITIKDVELRYAQIEPVPTFSSDKNNPRFCTVTNSNIKSFEYTETDNKDPNYSRVTIDNLTSEKFTVRSITFNITNSDIKIQNLINSINGTFTNTKIRIPYDAQTNSTTPINCSYLRTLKHLKNNITFDTCDFVIENPDPSLTPIGYALIATGRIEDLSKNNILIDNCTFDKRLERSIEAFANGTWIIKNTQLAGSSFAVLVGGYKDFMSQVTLINNDYSHLKGNSTRVFINNHNTKWKLNAPDSFFNNAKVYKTKGNVGDLKKQILKI